MLQVGTPLSTVYLLAQKYYQLVQAHVHCFQTNTSTKAEAKDLSKIKTDFGLKKRRKVDTATGRRNNTIIVTTSRPVQIQMLSLYLLHTH